MFKVPIRVSQRLTNSIKAYQPILKSAYSRDINESDTVTIVKDILSDVLGYDKYLEVTSEFQIRSTYCDLATIIDGKVTLLIEVKAIGINLKEVHIRQAIDYAANEGIDWVILTNGIRWEIFKVKFVKPISHELVFDFDFLNLNPKKDIDLLYPLTKEGSIKSTLEVIHEQRQAVNRITISSLILSEKYLTNLKRDIKKLSPNVKVDTDQIKEVIESEIIKREVIENDQLKDATKRANKIQQKRKSSQSKPEVNNELQQDNVIEEDKVV